jgi:hypothetical protein
MLYWSMYRTVQLVADIISSGSSGSGLIVGDTTSREFSHFRYILSLITENRSRLLLNAYRILSFNFDYRYQSSGSMTFWCRSGSADPCLGLMDPILLFSSLSFKKPTKNLFFL